jgi:glycosyltransferase involved in cell wall biosynthesis
MSRNIHLVTPTLAPYDAIGNDVAQMRIALMESGHVVRVFAEAIDPVCASIADPIDRAPRGLWKSSDDILIYHHSIGWPRGEEILFNTDNKVILRYHNITPAHFFAPFSLPFTQACESGIESTKRIAHLRNLLFVGASTWNCQDLISYGASPEACRVLPPFHLTEELGREMFDIETVSRYAGATVNILFVGGLKPNKGHAGAIRVFAEYQRNYNDRSRLIFAGSLDERLGNYLRSLKSLARHLGVAANITFTGRLTNAQIKSLYVSADVFLCASEHEGFCVPLVESMYFRVPVVAWGSTAVRETMGDYGAVIKEWDEAAFAAQIDRVVEDDEMAEHLGTSGRRRYQQAFSPGVLRKKLDGIIEEAASSLPSGEKGQQPLV